MYSNSALLSSQLRFKRWSRKSYAVFATLGKSVTIGYLKVHMATKVLFAFVLEHLTSFNADGESVESEQNESLLSEFPAILEAIPVLNTNSADIAGSSYVYFQPEDGRNSATSANPTVFLFLLKPIISILKYTIMRKTIIFCLFAVLVFPALALEFADTTAIQLKQVNVDADRKKQFPDIGRVVRRVDGPELMNMPMQSTETILRTIPGVDIRQRGVGGTQSDISLRGGSFDQVLVLLNGIDISDPQTGHHHLNLPLDAADMSSVEVLQGAASRRYGTNAFSGAVNFITEVEPGNNIKAEATYGSFNTHKVRVAANVSSGEFRNFTSVVQTASDGYRHNTDFKRFNLYSLTQWNNDKFGTAELQLGLQHKSFGANGFYSLSFPEQFEHTRTLFSSLRWKKSWESLDMTAQLNSRRHYDRFELFRDFKGAAPWYSDHNYHQTDVHGGGVSMQYFSKIGKFSGGFNLRNDHVYSTVLGHLIPEDKEKPLNRFEKGAEKYFTREDNRFIKTGFVDYTGNWNQFIFSGGVSLSDSRDFGTHVNYGAELSYFIQNDFSLFVSANTASRLPTFTDLFFRNATHEANPDLQAETSLNLEGGISYSNRRLQTKASVFHREGRNIIDWVRYAGATKWKSQNLVAVNTLGAEVSAEYKPESRYLNHLKVAYTWIDSDKVADGFDSRYALDYLRHQLLLGVDHRIISNVGASWNVSLSDRAGDYRDFASGGFAEYKPFVLVNTRIRWDINKIQLYADINNLLNVDYVDFGGLPLPGFHMMAGLKWRLM